MKTNELEDFCEMLAAFGVTCLVNTDSAQSWIVLSKTDSAKTYDDELITVCPQMDTVDITDEYVLFFELDGSFKKIEVPEPAENEPR